MPVAPAVLAAFVLASVVLLVIPGPTIVMVVSQALAHGRRVALASVLGVGLGDLLAASLSIAGVGTLLAASATAFTILKWIGGAYLVFLGVKLWRAPVPDLGVLPQAESEAPVFQVFLDAFVVTALNPKGIIFFLAFVPQFIDHGHAFAPQAALLVAVFVVLGIVNAYLYAMLASSARGLLARRSVLRATTRAGACLLMGAGVAAALARRTA
ncbi:LysE family translocator [Consotaella salsifontis]|uniref:Threonine/homoserine/homoserine lactone efflux protein n=1 Tax=Consotaella salsifontis TaxID=1365950 RepID=A0A1T4Q0E7_9HYPH|nr:LysE family translocator [Consotaella salsifontis]SJZ96981.1 Threonine/homoserine/homoserine lactone efflux protein [Consotaella salsifontis]